MRTTATIIDKSIADDLAWMDILKGIAIIGVVFDHWIPYWASMSSSPQLYSLFRKVPWGTPVQLFFLLSGFGLMMSYINNQSNWSWRRWTYRRITKIVVPYWLAVLFSFVAGILASGIFRSVDLHFSWKSLLACLTFTRSFFPASWAWNIALWFMPIIIGLYMCFPMLAIILRKKGVCVLLVVAAILTYGSIFMSALLTGKYRRHDESFFLFFIIQFALGMALAHARDRHPQKLDLLIGFKSFVLGSSLYILSWGVKTYLPNGSSYNDVLTTAGLFLVLLNLIWIIRMRIPVAMHILENLGKRSYLIFLVHYPILAFIIGPLFRISLDPIVILASGLIFIFGVYFVCSLISRPMDRFTSWLYGLVQ
jgi:peptidoglycan/LPS O-acetylase OafA/YrhL